MMVIARNEKARTARAVAVSGGGLLELRHDALDGGLHVWRGRRPSRIVRMIQVSRVLGLVAFGCRSITENGDSSRVGDNANAIHRSASRVLVFPVDIARYRGYRIGRGRRQRALRPRIARVRSPSTQDDARTLCSAQVDDVQQ